MASVGPEPEPAAASTLAARSLMAVFTIIGAAAAVVYTSIGGITIPVLVLVVAAVDALALAIFVPRLTK